ncbi:ABC transporter permease [Sulfolobaceae archaeon RB850M]
MRKDFIIAFIKFYGVSSLKRGYIYVLSYLVVPFSELFLIYMISKGAFLNFAIIGGLITVVAGNGLTFIGDFAFLRLEVKIQDLLVASEISVNDYVLALMFSNLVFSFPGILVYLALGFLFRLLNFNVIPVLAVLLLLLLVTSGIGFFIGSIIPHIRYSWGLASVLSVLLTILPPVFYPYYLLPQSVFRIVYFIPTTIASLLIQQLTGLISLPANLVYQSVVVLIVESTVFYYLSIKYSRWVSQ